MLDTIASLDTRKQMEVFVDNCQLETPDEVARLFREYTWLIWDYKLIGKIYDYYPDEILFHREHTFAVTDVETVVANTMAFTAAVPDNETLFLDIFAEGNQEEGYRFFQATRTIGTNTGYSSVGAPTGKSFEAEGGAGIGTCECLVQKVDGHWKIVEEWLVRSTLAEKRAMTVDAGGSVENESIDVVGKRAENVALVSEHVKKQRQEGEDRMSSVLKSQEIKRLCNLTDHTQLADEEEVRAFVWNLTKLVYDYKMTGKIYDFYNRDVEYYKQNKILFRNIEEVVAHTAAFCAAFPNLETEIENIIVYQETSDFYKVSRRMLFHGTNTGYSEYGSPTGKSLEDCCRNLTMIHLRRIDGEWKITFEISNDCEEWLRQVMAAPVQ